MPASLALLEHQGSKSFELHRRIWQALRPSPLSARLCAGPAIRETDVGLSWWSRAPVLSAGLAAADRRKREIRTDITEGDPHRLPRDRGIERAPSGPALTSPALPSQKAGSDPHGGYDPLQYHGHEGTVRRLAQGQSSSRVAVAPRRTLRPHSLGAEPSWASTGGKPDTSASVGLKQEIRGRKRKGDITLDRCGSPPSPQLHGPVVGICGHPP